MTALTKSEEKKLRKLLTKMISGQNGSQMTLFKILHDLDVEVHYEDNNATRQHWYRKWFNAAFQPDHLFARAQVPEFTTKE